MQMMSWMVSRLGSRLSFLFEPYRRRVQHSALGLFYDQSLELAVGMIEPDGTERVFPFCSQGSSLYNVEQFERMNSVTFRGYSEAYRLRMELNVHSVFYPGDEVTSTTPAVYFEVRLNPVSQVRWVPSKNGTPSEVKLFFRVRRPKTKVTAHERAIADPKEAAAAQARALEDTLTPPAPSTLAHLDMDYRVDLSPQVNRPTEYGPMPQDGRAVAVRERIESINPEAEVDPHAMNSFAPASDGAIDEDEVGGLTLTLPVTEDGSGVKWRIVWGAFCGEPILQINTEDGERPARFRYASRLDSLDALMADAAIHRDDRLAHSRRFEKLFDQTQLRKAQRHLMHQSFQAFLSNTFWCDVLDEDGQPQQGDHQWFSDMEGGSLYQSTLDVEYNVALFYLSIWPELLAKQLRQWPRHGKAHGPSGGAILAHDVGQGTFLSGPAFGYDMPVEENSNYLLLLQAYAHWTGDLTLVREQAPLIRSLATYLIWTDRDESGFPSEGSSNTLADAKPAVRMGRKQTYLAVKRLVALRAAGDMLSHVDEPGDAALASRCEALVEQDAMKIDAAAWLGDHYAVCVDSSATGMTDEVTGEPVPMDELPGWDAYSIYSGNGLLLPAIIGQPCPMDIDRMLEDITNARRETMGSYGCGHSSQEPENVWISQNLWRDHLARYLGLEHQPLSQRYWDLQVMSNTADQSYGYCDTYIGNQLAFTPRGAVSFGYLLAHPRLVIDRLAAGGQRISVSPDRYYAQRWPLTALADWKAGKIPVCVVSADGHVHIENETDPVIVHGDDSQDTDVIG